MENTTPRRHLPIEQTAVFKRFKAVANELWTIARSWDGFARASVGLQMVKAADSVGANLVEGDGRKTDPDAIRFFGYARASSRETQHWIEVAKDRALIPPAVADRMMAELDEAGKMLNGLIDYRSKSKYNTKVKEPDRAYNSNPDLEPSAQRLAPDASNLEPSAQSLEPDFPSLAPEDLPRAWSLVPSASELLTDDQL